MLSYSLDEHRVLGDVDLVADELSDHGREVFVQIAGALDDFDQRGIQPDAPAPARSLNAVAALQAFADETDTF